MKMLLKILMLLVMAIPLAVFSQVDVGPAGDTSYFRELVDKGNATYADAYRMINILAKGHDTPDESFDDFKNELLNLEIIPQKWSDFKADEFINRGQLAYMLVKALGIKGGLTTRIFGPTPRYAFRECVMRKLIASGFPNELVSGGELISVLSRAERFQEEGDK